MHNLFTFLLVSQIKIAAPWDNWKISFAFSSIIYKSSGFIGVCCCCSMGKYCGNNVLAAFPLDRTRQGRLVWGTSPPSTLKVYSKRWLTFTAYTVRGSLSQLESAFIHSSTTSSILLALWPAGRPKSRLPFIQGELLIALIGNRCRYKNFLLLYRIHLKHMDETAQKQMDQKKKKSLHLFFQQETSVYGRKEPCRKRLFGGAQADPATGNTAQLQHWSTWLPCKACEEHPVWVIWFTGNKSSGRTTQAHAIDRWNGHT